MAMENQSFIELIVTGCSIDMFDRQGILIIPMNFVSLHALHSSFLVWSTLFAKLLPSARSANQNIPGASSHTNLPNGLAPKNPPTCNVNGTQ